MVEKKIGPGDYEIIKEGNEEVLKINFIGVSYPPSLEDSTMCMSRTIDILTQVPRVKRIIFSEKKNYEYDYDATQMLIEIANLYSYLTKQKRKLSMIGLGYNIGQQNIAARQAIIQNIVFNLLRSDPLGAYVELLRIIREERIKAKKERFPKLVKDRIVFINLLIYVFDLLDKTKLITLAKPDLAGYIVGNREVYRHILRPIITPNFLFTKLMSDQPLDGEILDSYKVNGSDVTIFKVPGDIKYLYHVTPPELKLSEEKYELLDLARNVLAQHKPKSEEFIDPTRMRQTFFNIGKDMLQELSEKRGLELPYEEIEELARILVRYTIGFGMVEILLQDDKVQDISINSPIGQTPIFIVHGEFEDCVTNIVPSTEDGESWATKFRMLSGRPLDEANPILDTELILPKARARTAIISRPLNPMGLAFAFRRHRDTPWTFPLFMQNKMMNGLAAGLLSFLIDGSRTLIIAGTRSSGKTSLLGAVMLEIMRKYRVITIEDTMELPVMALRSYGYNIQPMKVRSAIVSSGAEISADEGIRTSLRLGDSSLIVGEVRSLEAKALYEAMRVGALANVVAGTIHGGSPYAVFDRVVNDLEVPTTSFKATDIIVICNPIKSPDGLHKWRRITQITEVRKNWTKDPMQEKAFVDLMKYNPKTDELEPTDALINGDSEILKNIGGNVKDWAGDWDAIWENIMLRKKLKETLLKYSEKLKRPDLLEAEFSIQANDQFHILSEEIKEKTGKLNSKKIFFEWEDWLKKEVKKKR